MATNTAAPQTPNQNIRYMNIPPGLPSEQPEQRLMATTTYDQRNDIGFASTTILCLSISIIILDGLMVVGSTWVQLYSGYLDPSSNCVMIGLLVIMPTGIIGVFVFVNSKRRVVGQGLNVVFLITSILSAVCSLYIAVVGVILAVFYFIWPDDMGIGPVGVVCTLFAVTAMATSVMCIVACTLTLRGTFCTSSHTTAQYSIQNSNIMAGEPVRVMPAASVIPHNIPVNNSMLATPYQGHMQDVAATRQPQMALDSSQIQNVATLRPQMAPGSNQTQNVAPNVAVTLPQMTPDSNPTPQATSVNMEHVDNHKTTGVNNVAGQDSNLSDGKPVENTWEKF